jgi:hypothetical protein
MEKIVTGAFGNSAPKNAPMCLADVLAGSGSGSGSYEVADSGHMGCGSMRALRVTLRF